MARPKSHRADLSASMDRMMNGGTRPDGVPSAAGKSDGWDRAFSKVAQTSLSAAMDRSLAGSKDHGWGRAFSKVAST